MWTGHFHPQHHAHFVCQVVNARVNASNMYPHQITSQLFHSQHVLTHLLKGGNVRLIQNSIEIDRLVIQIDGTCAGLYLAQAKARGNL